MMAYTERVRPKGVSPGIFVALYDYHFLVVLLLENRFTNLEISESIQ